MYLRTQTPYTRADSSLYTKYKTGNQKEYIEISEFCLEWLSHPKVDQTLVWTQRLRPEIRNSLMKL